MSRQRRPYEMVCDCDAYHFPHRLFVGACTGMQIIEKAACDDSGYMALGKDCRQCNMNDSNQCSVLLGIEPTKEAPCLQEFVRYEGIRPPKAWQHSMSYFRSA